LTRKRHANQEEESETKRPFTHELYTLQIDPTWQRQGIGRRLITQIAAVVKQGNSTRLLVKVLADNPNVPFYERLGAVWLGSNPFE